MIDVKKMIEELNEHLKIDYNVGHSTLDIKLDKSYDKLIFISKKNYSGLINGNHNSKGLDYLKSSTLKYAANLQKNLLEEILFRNNQDFQSLFHKYHSDYWKESFDDSNIDLITLKQRVTKHPDKYTTSSAAVEVAKWMIQNGKLFYPGLFVSVIVTGHVDGKIQGVHPESGLWKGKIDGHYIWNHQILPKLSRITEILSPEFDWKQFDSEIVSQRLRKISQYEKWLLDSSKNQHVLDKIKNDGILSQEQKGNLIQLANRNTVRSLW